jgi:hypothetical protein
MDCDTIKTPEEFSDICPISDSEFHNHMARMVHEPKFEHAIRYVMPDVDYDKFIGGLLQITNKRDFQVNIMFPFLQLLEQRTTSGISGDGTENIDRNKQYTFITNHRDIVLDASFLNINLLRHNLPTCEIAIGSNLLVYDWIATLVKLNKSFIVKRGLPKRDTLPAAYQLSGYIHFAVTKKHESVWIAQRQGRAKDSNDLTQESLVKMLSFGKEGNVIDSLQELNLMPVAISYEYDPNDYLKAKEFLLRSKDPDFKKSQRDDLFSMETGLLQHKGHIHFEFTPCVTEELNTLRGLQSRPAILNGVCSILDKAIHSNYRLYTCNYIAHDLLTHSEEFAAHYTAEEKEKFSEYLKGQLAKVDIPVNDDDKAFLREKILTMYSNPLTNKIHALGGRCDNL